MASWFKKSTSAPLAAPAPLGNYSLPNGRVGQAYRLDLVALIPRFKAALGLEAPADSGLALDGSEITGTPLAAGPGAEQPVPPGAGCGAGPQKPLEESSQ